MIIEKISFVWTRAAKVEREARKQRNSLVEHMMNGDMSPAKSHFFFITNSHGRG
jgi:hypothetical protein